MDYLSHSPEETKSIAASFAQALRGGEVVALEGELGAGKTTFVQGLAEALGASGPVRSPTFAIMNIYKTTHGSIKEIVHLDLYRLERQAELESLGLEDWLGKSDTLAVVEWPAMIASEATVRVEMRQGPLSHERSIRITPLRQPRGTPHQPT